MLGFLTPPEIRLYTTTKLTETPSETSLDTVKHGIRKWLSAFHMQLDLRKAWSP